MGYLSDEQLLEIGFKSIGENVKISDKCSIYNSSNISIGNNVRIDDFVVLSAGDEGIVLGSYIHIAVFSSLIGKSAIIINDYANISSRVSIYSSSDDYSGETMTSPVIPDEYKSVTNAPVVIGRHVILGSGSVVLPGVTLENGVAVGALSLVNKSIEEFVIAAGVPAKKIKARTMNLLELEKKHARESRT